MDGTTSKLRHIIRLDIELREARAAQKKSATVMIQYHREKRKRLQLERQQQQQQQHQQQQPVAMDTAADEDVEADEEIDPQSLVTREMFKEVLDDAKAGIVPPGLLKVIIAPKVNHRNDREILDNQQMMVRACRS